MTKTILTTTITGKQCSVISLYMRAYRWFLMSFPSPPTPPPPPPLQQQYHHHHHHHHHHSQQYIEVPEKRIEGPCEIHVFVLEVDFDFEALAAVADGRLPV